MEERLHFLGGYLRTLEVIHDPARSAVPASSEQCPVCDSDGSARRCRRHFHRRSSCGRLSRASGKVEALAPVHAETQVGEQRTLIAPLHQLRPTRVLCPLEAQQRLLHLNWQIRVDTDPYAKGLPLPNAYQCVRRKTVPIRVKFSQRIKGLTNGKRLARGRWWTQVVLARQLSLWMRHGR
jgi:hypothetical protein